MNGAWGRPQEALVSPRVTSTSQPASLAISGQETSSLPHWFFKLMQWKSVELNVTLQQKERIMENHREFLAKPRLLKTHPIPFRMTGSHKPRLLVSQHQCCGAHLKNGKNSQLWSQWQGEAPACSSSQPHKQQTPLPGRSKTSIMTGEQVDGGAWASRIVSKQKAAKCQELSADDVCPIPECVCTWSSRVYLWIHL